MDLRSRQFFIALNRIEHSEGESKIDVVDINNLKIEDLAKKYEKYAIWYNDFIKFVDNPEKLQQCRQEKRNFDRMYRFWINPYHMALRNTIGKINADRKECEIIKTDKGDKARLTQEAINKIKSEVNGKEVAGKENSYKNSNQKIEEIESYPYDSGIANQLRTYIRKYKLSFEADGIEYSKQIYGEIDINKFEMDEEYRKIILEKIEDLEIDNYNMMRNNNYIGSFTKISRNGQEIWQNVLRDGDIDAIDKLEKYKIKYKESLENEAGDDR